MFILGNQAEVELGNLAAEKTQNAQVREFAEQMVKDHTAFIAKLKKFAADNEAAPRSGNTSASAQPSSGSHDAMANLQRKAAELELSMTKQMLSKHEGQDFDMGYLGQQMVAHTKMLACLTAAKDVGPQEFQTTLEEGITTTREHMQHAQQIAAAIKNKEYGEGQGNRPALREAQRPDGVIRNGQTRDGGARPAVRPQNSDAPREGAPQRGTPRVNPSGDREQTDGASAGDREESTP
jgi:predicted outer membrane protein